MPYAHETHAGGPVFRRLEAATALSPVARVKPTLHSLVLFARFLLRSPRYKFCSTRRREAPV